MFIIKVNNLKLYGYHGIYKEEAIVGGDFLLNITIGFEEESRVEELHQTLNYVRIVEITKEIFLETSNLLETVAQKIVDKIKDENNFIKNINISIQKLNAPISNFTGTVEVQFSKTF